MEISKIKFAAGGVNSNGGHQAVLLYTLDPDEEMDTFAHGMMVNNNIKGIMPYSTEMQNGHCVLCYSVRYTALATLFKQTLKRNVVLSILKNIGGVMRNAEDYMLDPAGFVLEEDYIFVNPNNLDVMLVYAPTTKHYGKTYKVFVKSCVINNAFDLSEDATFPSVINNHINQVPNESNSDLAKFLENMLHGNYNAANAAPAVPAQNMQVQPPAFAQNTPVQNMSPAANIPPQNIPAQNGGFAQKNAQQRFAAPPTVAPAVPVPPQPQPKPKPEKKSLFGGKKEKTPKPQNAPAAQPSAFGGMAVPGQGGFSGMAIPGQPAPAPQVNIPAPPPQVSMPAPHKFFGKPAAQSPKQQNMPAQPMNMPAQQLQMPMQQNNMAPIIPQGGFAPVDDPIINDNATVLIHGGGKTNNNNAPSAPMPSMSAVIVDKNGRSYPIQKPAFFIGKGNNTSIVNDLIVPNQNVSRNHAVIENNGGAYFLTDSNSLNGTFVNGERLAANMKRQLKNGDTLRFANEEYTFRLN